MEIDTIELYGYVCSTVVAISFLTKDMTKLRILNCIGCFMFGIYGFLKDASPIIVINAFVMVIHIYYLIVLFLYKNKK